jgi:hypothetical protein
MVFTAAAQGRLFFSGDRAIPELSSPPTRFESLVHSPQRVQLNDPRLASVTAASRLAVRPVPEMLPSGIAAINSLTGGWPRGCLTELCGPTSSGRTTVLLAALAAATRYGEFCVLVDASDALDPRSAEDAGVELDRLLWVRCGENSPLRHRDTEKKNPLGNQHSEYPKNDRIGSRPKRQTEHRLEQVLHATDLLLESGGFGLVVLDLSDLPPQQARRIPLTTWFRFRRAIEHTPTVLLAVAQHPIAGSCSSLLLELESSDSMLVNGATERRKNAVHSAIRGSDAEIDEAPERRKKIRLIEQNFSCLAHAHLLSGLEITAELIHSRLERKPAHSITFATKTAWDTPVASTQLPVARKIAGY